MWDEIYRAHYPELLRYGIKACGNEAQAEDLVQETFMRALQRAEEFEDFGPSQRRAWLFRTLKNLICDRYRRAAVEEAYIQEIREDALQTEPGYGKTEAELILRQLPQEEYTLFYLRYMEGYSAAELAQMFQLPPGTVRSRLSRSRKILKDKISEI